MSEAVPIIAHSGELILTVDITHRLNEELKRSSTLSPKLKSDIQDLLNTIQVKV